MLKRIVQFLLLWGLVTGCATREGPPPLVLGHVAPLSGQGSEAGDQAARGIRLAVAELAKADYPGLGRPVVVHHADTGGQAKAWEAEAVRLARVNRSLALIGGTTSTEIAALDRAGVPVLALGGTPPPGASGRVFFLGLRPDQIGDALARFSAEELMVMNVTVLVEEGQDPELAMARAFAKKLGFLRALTRAGVGPPKDTTPVPVLFFGKDQPLKELANQLKETKPAGLFFAGSVANLRILRKELGELRPPILFAGDGGFPPAPAALDGLGPLYLVTAFAVDADLPKTEEFAKKFREAFQAEPDAAAALAFEGAELLFEALRRNLKKGPGEELSKELAELKDFPGPTGPLSFGKDHLARRDAFVVELDQGKIQTRKRFSPEEKETK